MLNEKRRLPIFDWFEMTFEEDNAGVYFPNVDVLSQSMKDQYNGLRRKIPELTIERHQVSFQPKTKQERFLLSTNILTLLNHFLEGKWTLPLWHEEVCCELFLEGDNGFVEKASSTINENPTPVEMKLYSAICQRILAGNEKKKTDGKTRDHENNQNKVLPGKIKLKKQQNDKEETNSDDDDLFFYNLMRPLE